ncbi:MAG: hypothetical protein NXY57DRAFT_969692, partial [Lentinula lateritia]
MSRPLKDDKKVSADESNRYFWYGLHKHDRKEILGRIELKDSTFDRTTVPDMELAFKMGREVFSDDVLGMESDDPIAEMFTKPKKKKKGKVVVIESTSESEDVEDSDSSESKESEEEKPKRKKTVKQVVRTKIVEKPETDSVEDLAKQLRALNVQDVNYAGVYARLATISPVVAGAIAALPPIPQIVTTAAIPAVQMAPYPNRPLTPATYPNSIEIQRNNYRRGNGMQRQAPGPLPADILCFFCKENHLIRDCTHLPEYLRTSRVSQIGRWFCWPDNHPQARRRIPSDPTTDRQAITGAVTVEANEDTSASSSRVEGRVEEIIDVDAIEEDGDTWMEPLELERVEENVGMAVTRSAGKRKQREEDTEDQPKVKETRKQPRIPVNLPGPLTTSGSKPAFTYESKAEDPNAATKMFRRTLDVVVPDVTVRDLVSLSSDLRKQWIDHTKVQRIPTTTDEPI